VGADDRRLSVEAPRVEGDDAAVSLVGPCPSLGGCTWVPPCLLSCIVGPGELPSAVPLRQERGPVRALSQTLGHNDKRLRAHGSVLMLRATSPLATAGATLELAEPRRLACDDDESRLSSER
jgi:hypothetical protein